MRDLDLRSSIYDLRSRSKIWIPDPESKIQDPKSGSEIRIQDRAEKTREETQCTHREKTMSGNTDAARENGQGRTHGTPNAHHAQRRERKGDYIAH